jgi:hypothetical protein
MIEIESARKIQLFLKGATGLRGDREDLYSSRFYFEQGHLSAGWRDYLEGRLFLRERVFHNRGRLMLLVSNDSQLISRGGEGLAAGARASGPVTVRYAGAVFRDPQEQKENGGIPPAASYGDYLNLLDAGIRRPMWHLGITMGRVRSQRIGDSAMFGIDGGFGLGGGSVNLEYARSAEGQWSDLADGIDGIDWDAVGWGRFSAGLPADAALSVEWTGFDWDGWGWGTFGITPGYLYVGNDFIDSIGELPEGSVRSYAEIWWRHAKLASLVSLKAADAYDYSSGEGGGLLETSVWTRFKGGLETTARAFFTEGRRPALLVTAVDDNSLTRMSATARIDDAGGKGEFSFLAAAGVNIGRRWTLGGTIYLERSTSGYYSVDIGLRGGERYFLSASAGTYIPGSKSADLNYSPAPPVTEGDRIIAIYTRIWLGGI